jgi:hypothetical protein
MIARQNFKGFIIQQIFLRKSDISIHLSKRLTLKVETFKKKYRHTYYGRVFRNLINMLENIILQRNLELTYF